jgi:hypothetical protein
LHSFHLAAWNVVPVVIGHRDPGGERARRHAEYGDHRADAPAP